VYLTVRIDLMPVCNKTGIEKFLIKEEKINWDQASVLQQIGLLSKEFYPILGEEASFKAKDPNNHNYPYNELITKDYNFRSHCEDHI